MEGNYKNDPESEGKKPSGVVEEKFLENMKSYNNLKDALKSLSSDIDKVFNLHVNYLLIGNISQVANERSDEVSCDNSVADTTKCKHASAKPIHMKENGSPEKENEVEGWFSSVYSYFG